MREVLKATGRIFAGSTLQISVLVRHALAFVDSESFSGLLSDEGNVFDRCVTSHTASDTRRLMEALGQRVSEVCVLSINATNRRAPSVNECVCVCPFFQSALR